MFEKSKWIWLNNQNNKDEYGEFKIEFTAEQKSAVINLSCDGDYTLFVNGKYVASNQYADFEHYKIYDQIDITPFIVEGENSAEILVWHFGDPSQKYIPYTAGVIFEVVQGGNVLILSNQDVKCRKSPVYRSGNEKKITAQLGYSFLYDARGEGEKGGYSNAVEVEKNCNLFPRPNKKLVVKEKAPVTVLKNEGNYFLIDLGRETVGLPVLEFNSEKEQKILVTFGEILQDGHVKRIIDHRDFSFEYIAKKGENSCVNYMLRLGCRYLEVYAESPITLGYIGVLPQVYPVTEKKVQFDNPLDKRIYDLCVSSLKLCMMEHYVDCPWREQNLYVFDSRNQMLCGYYAFENGNAEYVKSNLKLISQDRRKNGLLAICFPCGTDLTIPSFSLYYFLAVREYLEHTGDTAFVEEIYGKLQTIIQEFINNRKNGLACKFEGVYNWNFYDWTEHMEGSLFVNQPAEPDVMVNLLFILALQNLKFITEKLGKEFKFADMLTESIANTRKAFLCEKNGLFSMTMGGDEYTVLANSLAIITGVASKKESEKIAQAIADGKLLECTLSMRAFKYDALLAVSEEKWLPFIFEEIRRDYKMMLDCGATATWETIDGAVAFDNAGSLCHGWSAVPVYYYWKYILNK